MKAAYHIDTNTFELREIPKPEPKQGEVLIKVMAVGFCGSDLHDLATPPCRQQIPGHEFSGVVEECGDGVNLEHGLRVVVDPGLRCGKCPACLSGEDHLCPQARVYGCRGEQPPGALAEYIAVRAENLIPIGDHLSFEAATFGDPLGVAIHTITKGPQLEGAHVVVFGCGPLGLMTLAALAKNKVGRLFAVDVVPEKLALAEKMSGCTVLDNRDETTFQQLQSADVNICIDLAGGNSPVLDQSLQLLRKGGTILAVSQRPQGIQLNWQFLVFKEICLQGIVGKRSQDMRAAVELMKTGQIDVTPVITAQYSLDDVQKAFDHFRDPDSMKIIVRPQGDLS